MKPTERFKRRYVSFALTCDGVALPFAAAKDCVHLHFLSFFGELGIASLAFKLVKYDDKRGRGIVRCERGRVEETVLCMACMREWQGRKCRMMPLSVSGTIKRL
ncbi:Ribonuclease P protein component 2 [uncultured archaeon]|nr:Ribonuclease P protein component 2 [uncultured archaeon]